jgi:signal peptidase I
MENTPSAAETAAVTPSAPGRSALAVVGAWARDLVVSVILASPGDTVEVDNGEVVVNGQVLREDYVREEYRDHMSMAPYQVHEDEYFVLGDHRSSSNDSRAWGGVPRTHIYGKAVFVYWPLEKIGILR